MSTAAGSSLFSSKSWSEKMLAEESKSSSLVEPATRFLRHELRKIFIRHKKKKEIEIEGEMCLADRRCILRLAGR